MKNRTLLLVAVVVLSPLFALGLVMRLMWTAFKSGWDGDAFNGKA